MLWLRIISIISKMMRYEFLIPKIFLIKNIKCSKICFLHNSRDVQYSRFVSQEIQIKAESLHGSDDPLR